jgi:predicted  nucleic acid-binding Zn-ribbon protein
MRDRHERRQGVMDASGIEAATKRLAAALDSLEAALERRREADRSEAALADQVSALGTDRSRLAAELDQQTARAHRLEATSREVSRRLDLAMEAIRTVVDTNHR